MTKITNRAHDLALAVKYSRNPTGICACQMWGADYINPKVEFECPLHTVFKSSKRQSIVNLLLPVVCAVTWMWQEPL